MLLLAILVFGLFVGWIAQMLMGSGWANANWPVALVAGLVGSFVGGLLVSLISGEGLSLHPTGLIGSVVGAVLVTAGYQRWSAQAH